MSFTATTTNSAGAWRPDISTFAAADVIGDAAILAASTVAGSIQGDQPVIRVAYIIDDDATLTPEGEEIDEGEPTLDEVAIQTAKVTQLLRVSREQWSQEGTSDQLSQSVRRALIKRADRLFIAEAGTGLIHTPDLVDGGTVTDDLDALIDLEAELRENGSEPGLFLLAPSTWAALRRLKTSDISNESLLGSGTDDAAPRILGIPVLVNNAVPAGEGLLIDRSAIAAGVGEVEVASSDQQFFSSDSIAVRAVWRLGHAVVRPDRIGFFGVGDLGS
ncbi:major capsid protein [Gordonia paraffinivorans]|uniref:phage major capsid protein n=1 Tax=Gordonia paraffinivorans TaxID=175628 RepID=UPI000D61B2CE|nr:phage major capsid protein [Gordonia paraffinivorans]PWD44538.1 major capsid protein [Gordonia paraffinivorans]